MVRQISGIRVLHCARQSEGGSAEIMQRVSTNVEEDMLVKAIREEITWENLPKRLKLFLSSKEDWHRRIKEHCIRKRLKWSECHAKNACKETEYYEDLMRYLRKNLALFPYHLSENVCRIMRISPFRYYCDMLYEVMRNEKPYDSIPNFSAADVLRLTGVGRNEFIDIMNKCRAKRLMWKVNKAIAKEMLPTTPADFSIEPWWIACVVNLSLDEYRKLSESELVVIDKICKEQINLYGEFDPKVVRGLYQRGLVYLDVPIFPDDRCQVLNLEGFVSNREQSYEDPIEEILYAVFVASSEHSTISELASTLQLDLDQLQAAVSVACRLGWANKVMDPSALLNDATNSPRTAEGSDAEDLFSPDNQSPLHEAASDIQASGDLSKLKSIRAAFLVDATLTSYLMMGSFSPGLKNHAVTLYEAGKLGDSSIAEFCTDLKALESTKLEGELQQFVDNALSLCYALECLRSGGTTSDAEEPSENGSDVAFTAGAHRSYRVDVLRCESLATLTSGTLQRIFQRDYNMIVSMTPLASLPLPISHKGSGPVHFGPPSRAAVTPWMKLLLYTGFEAGPVSMVLLRGLRLRLLPPPLAGCHQAFIWTWDGSSFNGIGSKPEGTSVPGGTLLHTLNSILRHSAVLVQPFSKDEHLPLVTTDVPLPLQADSFKELCAGHDDCEEMICSWKAAADELFLHTTGYIRFLRVRDAVDDNWRWIPLSVEFGVPLSDTKLCKRVCEGVVSTDLFETSSLIKHHEAMQQLRTKLYDFIAENQSSGPVANDVYTSEKTERGSVPYLSSTLSVKWNPFQEVTAEVTAELESPSSRSGYEGPKHKFSRRRRSEVLSFDGDILRSVTRSPAVYQAKMANENSFLPSPRGGKPDTPDDFETGEVPLPGVNLLFDGSTLVPIDIGPCLQARLAPALVAEAAVASAKIPTV